MLKLRQMLPLLPIDSRRPGGTRDIRRNRRIGDETLQFGPGRSTSPDASSALARMKLSRDSIDWVARLRSGPAEGDDHAGSGGLDTGLDPGEGRRSILS